MKIHVKFDVDTICTNLLERQLIALGHDYLLGRTGEVELLTNLTEAQEEQLIDSFAAEGIFIIDDSTSKLVQRIKDCITEMISSDTDIRHYNTSTYLSEKLNYSYSHLSNVFSENTLGSIEHFVILKKIDFAKRHIIEGQLSFSEIAYKLKYSSSSHLSAQFRKTTGLTPSTFQRLIKKRKKQRLKMSSMA
jgi:AraC-like DNA-binding protein